MYSTSKTGQVIKEIGNYKLDILGISECRWTGSGIMSTKSETGESYTIIYTDQQDTQHRGVALIIYTQSVNTLKECEPIKARFNSSYCKLISIQCCAPTNNS